MSTSPMVAQNPVPKASGLKLAGFSLVEVKAAAKGLSKKDGGLNKGVSSKCSRPMVWTQLVKDQNCRRA